jgi:V8-like Glu-specific endopeptidase
MSTARFQPRIVRTGAFATIGVVMWLLVPCVAAAQGLPRATCDSSSEAVARDEASLRETIREALVLLFTDRKTGLDLRALNRALASIEIEFAGPGRLVPAPPDDPALRPPPGVPSADPPAVIDEWIGMNPGTCNQFRMRVPTPTRKIVADRATERGLGRANAGPDFRLDDVIRPGHWIIPFQEQYVPPQTGPYFSGCTDTRVRWSTATGHPRKLANFSGDGQASSCTGTMVGPRHVITAAHCVFAGGNWNDFYVIPARDGATWPVGSTLMSDTQGLNSGFRWYWVPAPLIDNPNLGWHTGLDIAILILPQRLGEGTGWMGVAARDNLALLAESHNHRNLGYPGQPGSPIGMHPFQVQGGLYGDLNNCDVGDFAYPDGDNWHRVADHSCDNSSGHSGGPIFHWVFDQALNAIVPVVSLIISGHDAFANDFDCPNDPRPYYATRITPEYAQWFLYFRSWKP